MIAILFFKCSCLDGREAERPKTVPAPANVVAPNENGIVCTLEFLLFVSHLRVVIALIVLHVSRSQDGAVYYHGVRYTELISTSTG